MTPPPRHRRLLFELRARGPASRTELVDRTGIRRNTVYDDVLQLLERGLIREIDAMATRVGRPRTPLVIDPETRHVVGVSMVADRVEVTRANLLGEPLGEPLIRRPKQGSLIRAAAAGLRAVCDDDTLAVGLSIPGFVDQERRKIIYSMIAPGASPTSLRPIDAAVGDRPVILGTEAHAVAARWLLTHAHAPHRDTLVIYFDDGALGSALMIHGQPIRGCISGANELGHTRLAVKTRPCYCGAVGCLERICDSQDLRDHGLPMSLADALAQGQLDHRAMRRMVELLAMGFGSAVNFTRAAHVIIASHLPHTGPVIDRLIDATRAQLLPPLRPLVRFDPWPEAASRSARTAAHLALARFYFETW